MTKRFSTSLRVWAQYGHFLMRRGKQEAARSLLQRSLKSLSNKQQRKRNSQKPFYSGTPLFRTSGMRTSRFSRHFALVRIAFPLTAIHYSPWNVDTPLFRKADKFFSPFSTVHNSLGNADAHLPLMQVCLPPLIDSTTGHYNSIGSHSSSLWSAFLTSVQQGRALECAFVGLNSTGTHCHTYWKYILEASKIWTPL